MLETICLTIAVFISWCFLIILISYFSKNAGLNSLILLGVPISGIFLLSHDYYRLNRDDKPIQIAAKVFVMDNAGYIKYKDKFVNVNIKSGKNYKDGDEVLIKYSPTFKTVDILEQK